MFPEELIEAAIEYVECIQKIESGRYQSGELSSLEDQRVQLHARLMDELDKAGVEYADRWEVTEIAFKIHRWRRR